MTDVSCENKSPDPSHGRLALSEDEPEPKADDCIQHGVLGEDGVANIAESGDETSQDLPPLPAPPVAASARQACKWSPRAPGQRPAETRDCDVGVCAALVADIGSWVLALPPARHTLCPSSRAITLLYLADRALPNNGPNKPRCILSICTRRNRPHLPHDR